MEVKDLDVKKIKVPQGYKVIIDPELIEQERRNKEKLELEEKLASMSEPSNEELITYAKQFHPYYFELSRLQQLNGNNI